MLRGLSGTVQCGVVHAGYGIDVWCPPLRHMKKGSVCLVKCFTCVFLSIIISFAPILRKNFPFEQANALDLELSVIKRIQRL